MNLKLLYKYIIALVVGVVFLDIQTRLVGFSASIPFALNEYQWTKAHVELSLFIMNFITYLIPLALITLIIGYLLARLLKLKSIGIIVLVALPSILLSFSSLDFITNLSFWYLDLPRLLIIVLGLWFSINLYNVEPKES